jgi:hypothetical protein
MARSGYRNRMNGPYASRVNSWEVGSSFHERAYLKMWKEDIVDYREFDCAVCHCHVYTWADDTRNTCAVCSWIKQMPGITPEEEAEIRVITATPILEKEND